MPSQKIIFSADYLADHVCFTITDDGKGFDPSAKKNGIGFYNISNRVKLFNGSLIIDSALGKGCLLSARIQSKAFIPQLTETIAQKN